MVNVNINGIDIEVPNVEEKKPVISNGFIFERC